MEKLIGNMMNESKQVYENYFSWGYYYYSASYYAFKKSYNKQMRYAFLYKPIPIGIT